MRTIHLQWFASVNNIKVSVGVENTAGTKVSRDYLVPITGLPGLDKLANTVPDPAIVGLNMATSEYLAFTDVNGDIPLAVRPVGGYASLLKSLLGTEEASPEQVYGSVRIRYTGSSASAKILFDQTNKQIRSLVGDKGSETGDANFTDGSSGNGTISLTSATADTMGEVVSLINGFSDYNCEKVFGLDALDASAISNETGGVQGESRWAYGWFLGAQDSGIYKHVFKADLSSTERPTLTIQKDGFEDQYLYAGCVVDQHQISGALKSLVEGSVSVLGFTEVSGATASTATLEDVDPLIFYKGDFTIKDTEFDFISSFELNFSNNGNPDGYGAGGVVNRQYHRKGMFEINGSMQVRLDTDSAILRNNLFADTAPFGTSLFLKGKNIDATNEVPELMVIELPYSDIQTYEFTENNGILDASIGFRAVNPKGSPISDPVTITLLTQDSAVY